MKRVLTIFACVLLLSCYSKKQKTNYSFSKNDTVVALVNVNWAYNGFSHLKTAREIKYVDKMVSVDSTTQKKQKALDTAYKVFWLENARDSAGKILKMVNGMDSIASGWVPIDKSLIIEVKEYKFLPKKN